MAHAVQRFSNVAISGIAHVDAPHVVTTAAIEEQLEPAMRRLGMRPGLLARVSGITERRFFDPGTMPSAPAAEAAARALHRSGVAAEGVGALINTSVIRDYIEPSTASIVHARLGLPPEAVNFDISNACLGFLNGMNVVAGMIERGEIEHGVVVDAEEMRFTVESTIARLQQAKDPAMFREQFATLTLGSGGVAMVLSRADLAPTGHRYLGGLGRARTEHALLSTAQSDGMVTDTRSLLTAGLEVGAATWKEAVDTFSWDAGGFDLYAVHQVSAVHTRAVADTLGLDLSRFELTYPRFGNIGPASVPIVVSKAAEAGRLQPGSKVALMGIGSGINAMAAEIVW